MAIGPHGSEEVQVGPRKGFPLMAAKSACSVHSWLYVAEQETYLFFADPTCSLPFLHLQPVYWGLCCAVVGYGQARLAYSPGSS